MAKIDQTRLSWHDQSRLFDAQGQVYTRPTARSGQADWVQLPDHDGVSALCTIYQTGKAAQGFCVYPPGRAPTVDVPASDAPVLGCMTSGTTSTAKLILRHQDSWRKSFAVNQGLWQITTDDSYAVLGALSHSLSLYAACEALQLGADLHLLTGLRPDRQAQKLRSANITVLYASPAQLRQIVQTARGLNLPALRLILIGGAKLDTQTRAALDQIAPEAAIHEFYGASETSFITLTDKTTPAGAAGRPYPGVILSIRAEDGTALPSGQTGEIWVESPYLFLDYAGAADAYTRRHGDALTVGEFGRLDEAGNLWIAGRKGRMITIADQNVFPEEVETCLLSVPDVTRAAVLPIADPRRGAQLIACVEANADLTDDTILRHCRAALGPLKSPRRILRPSPFPILASGKPDLVTLAALLERQPA